jgi:Ca2+/H+ antiporter, TMEM165/GDT1 family
MDSPFLLYLSIGGILASFIASFLFVVLAEMGDKTQLLAMAFACRYPARKVLIAVFFATLLNHSLAVTVGHFLSVYVPFGLISFVASLSFIFFGLWTLRGDSLSGEADRPTRFGPIVTVGIAFFLAEMGDKTQLATISLAIEYGNMLYVLLGTTAGMIVADGFGIIVGIVLRKRIPERTIKFVSATVFAAFGFIGVYGALSERIGLAMTVLVIGSMAVCTVAAAYYLLRKAANKIQVPPCS